jgi:hypothetical protein
MDLSKNERSVGNDDDQDLRSPGIGTLFPDTGANKPGCRQPEARFVYLLADNPGIRCTGKFQGQDDRIA